MAVPGLQPLPDDRLEPGVAKANVCPAPVAVTVSPRSSHSTRRKPPSGPGGTANILDHLRLARPEREGLDVDLATAPVPAGRVFARADWGNEAVERRARVGHDLAVPFEDDSIDEPRLPVDNQTRARPGRAEQLGQARRPEDGQDGQHTVAPSPSPARTAAPESPRRSSGRRCATTGGRRTRPARTPGTPPHSTAEEDDTARSFASSGVTRSRANCVVRNPTTRIRIPGPQGEGRQAGGRRGRPGSTAGRVASQRIARNRASHHQGGGHADAAVVPGRGPAQLVEVTPLAPRRHQPDQRPGDDGGHRQGQDEAVPRAAPTAAGTTTGRPGTARS